MLGPTPTYIVCRISFRNSLCWGPTRIEKSLLQAYFLSVNYCQYNIVVPRTLNLWSRISLISSFLISLKTNLYLKQILSQYVQRLLFIQHFLPFFVI
ncbi:hypothetical protein EE091_09995 [Staphylococcus aureus]|nr:hypothetical protein EE091_09995 [Staphylococcus aureus]